MHELLVSVAIPVVLTLIPALMAYARLQQRVTSMEKDMQKLDEQKADVEAVNAQFKNISQRLEDIKQLILLTARLREGDS